MAIQQQTARLQPAQHRLAGEMLARAFYDDPLSVYLVPNDAKRARVLPWLYERVIRYGAMYDGELLTTKGNVPASNVSSPSSPLPQAGEGPRVREGGDLLTVVDDRPSTPGSSSPSSPLPQAGLSSSEAKEEGPGVREGGDLLTVVDDRPSTPGSSSPSSPLPQAGLSSSEAKEEGPGAREGGELLTVVDDHPSTPGSSSPRSPLPQAGEGPGVWEDGELLVTPNSVDGVALWLPPGLSHTPMLRLVRSGLALAPFKFGLNTIGRFMATNTAERLRAKLAPEPHWYLWMIGVEPERQGHGIGSSLIEPMLQRADADGTPCYLETHKERNVTFYQKHGYNVIHSGNIPNGGPAYWCLKREPRR